MFVKNTSLTRRLFFNNYYGNISPSAQKFVKGSEYSKQLKLNDDLRDQLKDALSSDDIKIVDEICESYENLISISSEDNYASGFRDGAKLMVDIFSGENKNLKVISAENT